MKLAECVPNFSEGKDAGVIAALARPFRDTPGVKLLDVSSDPHHNRTVITAAGEPEALLSATFLVVREAVAKIDLNSHRGAHPRMGAADVVPFIPLKGVTMAECVALAKRLGEMVGEMGVPVVLYEEAASAPHRRNLAQVRKGEFEGWPEKIKDPAWRPDYGPSQVHPTAGVCAVGARPPLIAYNVNLNTSDLNVAKAIAKKVRHLGGGLRYVKALGVPAGEKVQVSMNLTDYRGTAIYQALEMVRMEARRFGVEVAGSEIVGLVPLAALLDTLAYYLGLESLPESQVLEARVWGEES